MDNLLYIVAMTVHIALSAMEVLLFLRAILSWIPSLQENFIARLIYSVTECFIFPIRVIFDAFGWGSDLPIDIPFFVTWIIVMVLSFIF